MIDETCSQETKITKILVAADGSPTSVRGIEHAVQLAKEKNAELIALYVDTSYEDMDSRGYGAWALLKDAKNKLDATGIEIAEVVNILEKHYDDAVKPISLVHGEAGLEVAEMLAKKQGVKINTMVKRGRAAETIVTVAKEENVGMIVIGSHGRRGFERIQLGSVADQVSKLAWCPVLIIKPDPVQ